MGRIRLVHYHTDTLGAAPTAKDLSLGEIAVNNNYCSPLLYIRNNNNTINKFPPHDCYFLFGNENTVMYKLFTIEVLQNAWCDYSGCFIINGKNSEAAHFYIRIKATSQSGITESSCSLKSINGYTPSKLHCYLYENNRFEVWWELSPWNQVNIIALNEAMGNVTKTTSNSAQTALPTNFTKEIIINRCYEDIMLTKSLNFAGVSFNGSSNVTIDKLDCGEF